MASGRDTEVEVRNSAESTAKPEGRPKLGTLLAEIGRRSGLSDEDFAVFERVRDKTPTEPLQFDSNSPND